MQKWSKKTRIETGTPPLDEAAFLRCKSGLRKQGLKHDILEVIEYIGTTKVARESTKTRIETLRTCRTNRRRYSWVARESTKTRIETSNLLEKGLIQKTGSGFRYLPRL